MNVNVSKSRTYDTTNDTVVFDSIKALVDTGCSPFTTFDNVSIINNESGEVLFDYNRGLITVDVDFLRDYTQHLIDKAVEKAVKKQKFENEMNQVEIDIDKMLNHLQSSLLK